MLRRSVDVPSNYFHRILFWQKILCDYGWQPKTPNDKSRLAQLDVTCRTGGRDSFGIFSRCARTTRARRPELPRFTSIQPMVVPSLKGLGSFGRRDPGLTPWANCSSAAARLVLRSFIIQPKHTVSLLARADLTAKTRSLAVGTKIPTQGQKTALNGAPAHFIVAPTNSRSLHSG